MIKHKTLTLFGAGAGLALALAACGGGGGGSTPAGSLTPPTTSAASGATKIGVTVAAASGSALPFATRRKAMSAGASTPTPVTVAYNGATVATGTLDGNNFSELTFSQALPAGATVTVTVGSGSTAIVATVTLATAIAATASDIVYNAGPPPAITVQSAADQSGTGTVEPGDPEQQTATENPSDGQDQNVNSNDGTLPANLPIAITACGTSTITVAPIAGGPTGGGYGLKFEEKVSDSDSSPKFEYKTTAFTGPLTFPYLSSAARIDLTVTQNGQELVSIEAPIGAVTGGGGASPSPSPASCPTLSPIATPSPDATSSPSASASPSASDSPSASPTPSASPSATP